MPSGSSDSASATRWESSIAARAQHTADELRLADDDDRRAKPYTAALAKLQDVLGVLNDSVVAHSLVQQAAAAEGAEAGTWHARVDGIVTGWCAAQGQARLSKLQKQWQDFAMRKRFWQKHPSAVYAAALERRRQVPMLPAPPRPVCPAGRPNVGGRGRVLDAGGPATPGSGRPPALCSRAGARRFRSRSALRPRERPCAPCPR